MTPSTAELADTVRDGILRCAGWIHEPAFAALAVLEERATQADDIHRSYTEQCAETTEAWARFSGAEARADRLDAEIDAIIEGVFWALPDHGETCLRNDLPTTGDTPCVRCRVVYALNESGAAPVGILSTPSAVLPHGGSL